MPKITIYYDLIYRNLTQNIPKEIRGKSGRVYGSTHWRAEAFAHVFTMTEKEYLDDTHCKGGAGWDITQTAECEIRARVDVQIDEESQVGQMQAEIDRLNVELTARDAALAAALAPAPPETDARLVAPAPETEREAQPAGEPVNITLDELIEMSRKPGAYRKIRDLALKAGVTDAQLPKNVKDLVATLSSHLKLVA